MKKIMVFGTFDILHPGHIFYLTQAKKYGDFLIVIIARDTTVEKIKGKKPVKNEKERLAQLKMLDIVDAAVLGNEKNKHEVIKKYQPEIICLGYDQAHFTDTLHEHFPHIPIIRIPSYMPHKYKTSLLLKKKII